VLAAVSRFGARYWTKVQYRGFSIFARKFSLMLWQNSILPHSAIFHFDARAKAML
jgi:hypothetical protein